ncbi:MAG: PrsW family intramembrane metalloprotease [Candidatus Spechtbacterales bacterium]|nr:PrsW family intramembrane metalloprotease [Candidatus Spechtbacterales bacterium]
MFFVLQKKHHEKTKDIAKIFMWGVAIAFPVVIIEQWAGTFVLNYGSHLSIAPFIMGFLVIGFVEEFAKYMVVRTKAMPYAFFDETQDAIVYMITAALGFAAIENIVYVLNFTENIQMILDITLFRGVSAVFLHVAASGVLGYFLALSLEHPSERRKFLYTGIIGATLLHGIFNDLIIKLEELVMESGCSYLFNIARELGQRCSEELFGISLIGTLLVVSGIIILIGLYKLANTRFNSQD